MSLGVVVVAVGVGVDALALARSSVVVATVKDVLIVGGAVLRVAAVVGIVVVVLFVAVVEGVGNADPARCKSVDINLAINVIHTAKNKNMMSFQYAYIFDIWPSVSH